MKKLLIITSFILAILIINIFTYKRITNSNESSNETTTIEPVTTTTEESFESTTVTIETIPVTIPDEEFFIPYSTSLTDPKNHIKNITNFDYVEDIETIDFGIGSEYSKLPGILSFRGNNFRNQTTYGNVTITENKLDALWSHNISNLGVWTGVGWTGQPLIVEWPKELREKMNIISSKRTKDHLKEIIYATLDGNIYFMDLDDGIDTRPPINVGYPHKGTASIDPRGYPLLYAGQGINLVDGQRVELGFRIFSLLDQSLLYFLDGLDPDMKRNWYAFDSSAIIDSQNDTVYEPGENGIFYKVKLNTDFDLDNGKISISPNVSKYRYDPDLNDRQGIENSMVTYKNYGYFADNSGFIQCINLNTLTPIWVNNLKEDTDASIVAEEDNGMLRLYVGSEVDFQGTTGISYVRCVDGLTGEFLWEKEYFCGSDENVNGGVLATPVLGTGELKDYVFFNIAKIDGSNRSLLVALDKYTGEEVWRYTQNNYSWSSPVFIESENNTYHIIQCDSIGQMILFDARTGVVQDVIDLGINIEGSPVLYDDILVVGTRGQRIWGIKIS